VKSKQGSAILDALELLDGETLKPRNSRYGKNVLDGLSQKSQGQVLNRSELISSESGVEYWTKFRIEPEFLSVVLAALVHSGDIVLSLAGKKIDAAGIDQFAKIGILDVTEFKHIDRPRDLRHQLSEGETIICFDEKLPRLDVPLLAMSALRAQAV
jgi:hypothetical protein